MVAKSISRRTALGLAGGVAAAAVGRSRRVRADALDKISLLNGWFAEAEQGGFYQALATGIYRDYGLDADIQNGGPTRDNNKELLAGRVDTIVSDGFAAVDYVIKGLPFLCAAAMMQKDPRAILSHPGMGNDTLPALKGKPILIADFGRTTYWPWMVAKFGFSEDQLRRYTFDLAPFLADKTVSVQAFVSSETMDVQKAGVEPVIHLLADYGFANYQTTINTSAKLVQERPEVLQRFIDASIKGWYSYLYGDPSPANALIKKINPDTSDEKIDFAIATMKKFGLVDSGDAKTLGIGAMTDARWAGFYKDMSEAGALPKGLDVKKAYTLQFVDKKVGMPG